MKYFLISESDFNQQYHCVGDNLAKQNGIDKATPLQSSRKQCESEEKKSSGINREETFKRAKSINADFRQRRRIDRQIKRALRKHKINTKLQRKN